MADFIESFKRRKEAWFNIYKPNMIPRKQLFNKHKGNNNIYKTQSQALFKYSYYYNSNNNFTNSFNYYILF